jgi:hypothetical protein
MRIKNIKAISVLTFAITISLTSCNDDFLEEKKDFGGVNQEVFQNPGLAKSYVDFVYGLFQPSNNAVTLTWDFASGGNSDFAKTTQELGGETNWNKVWGSISPAQAHCLPYIGTRLSGISISNNTWTRLRQINLFLDEIDKNGMSDADKNPLKGQMYFWRAYQYFELVKLYGGVPLVLTSQNPILDESLSTKTPRSSTSECIEQIVSDLEQAETLLSKTTWDSANWGRITSGACAAFKGRVLLTWASPIFNPTDDVARWQRAYDANLAAKTLLEAQGRKLYGLGTSATADGEAWSKMFTLEGSSNTEAVIVFGFNNSATQNLQKNNGSEKASRSVASGGSGSISPTKQMVDAFGMSDGKSIQGNAAYNPVLFYKNRDPRFSKTFAYNGATWKYAENTTFKQWTYSWNTTGTVTTTTIPNKFTEAAPNSSGIYVRKVTNETASSTSGYTNSGTDYIEMRFAEVVLNLAESAIGISNLTEAKTLIRSIRTRAGVVAGTNDYGLGDVTSRDEHFAAVLKERQVELAYENKLFYDLRRWMLFDNARGWNTRLGIPQLNGTRRTGFYIAAKKTDGTRYVGATDPFIPNAAGVAPIVNRDPVFPYTIPATGKNPGTVIATLSDYTDYLYTNYFQIMERDNLDPSTNNWKFQWYPQYYYFGIYQSLLDTAPYLEQTKGWGGTFDPLK